MTDLKRQKEFQNALKHLRNLLFSQQKYENSAVGLFLLKEHILLTLRKQDTNHCVFYIDKTNNQIKNLFSNKTFKPLKALRDFKKYENLTFHCLLDLLKEEKVNVKIIKTKKDLRQLKNVIAFDVCNKMDFDIVNKEQHYKKKMIFENLSLLDSFEQSHFYSFSEEKYSIFELVKFYLELNLSFKIKNHNELKKELNLFDELLNKEIKQLNNCYHDLVINNGFLYQQIKEESILTTEDIKEIIVSFLNEMKENKILKSYKKPKKLFKISDLKSKEIKYGLCDLTKTIFEIYIASNIENNVETKESFKINQVKKEIKITGFINKQHYQQEEINSIRFYLKNIIKELNKTKNYSQFKIKLNLIERETMPLSMISVIQ